jgi:hypothetical protein
MPEMETCLKEAVKAEKAHGDRKIQYFSIPPFDARNMGCDGHPKAADHRALADFLKPIVAKALKWKIKP